MASTSATENVGRIQASTCTSNCDRPTEATSDDNFRQLLVDFSEWYDRLGERYLNFLKVLYSDHVENKYELQSATEVRQLLSLLISSGNLSSTNLTILYDTLKTTDQRAFKTKLRDFNLPDFEEWVVSKFAQFRLNVRDFGMTLTPGDVKRLDGRYNEPPKSYKDSWCLIMDLEQRKELDKENLTQFIEILQRNDLQVVARIFQNVPGAELHETRGSTVMMTCVQETDDIIRKHILKRQKRLCQGVNRFTPSILNTRYEIDISDMFTDLEILKVNKIEQDSRPTTLDDVLHIVKSTHACKVLVEGEAGIGKSTLLRYIAYDWATGTGNFKDKLLFLINVRDIEADEDILDVVVKKLNLIYFELKTDLRNTAELVKRFIANHDDEIILLLDGLDELRNENKSLINLFKKEELENSKVILTSRSKKIDQFVKKTDLHVKVKGFSDDNVKKYIRKHFTYLRKPALAVSLITELHPRIPRYNSEFKRLQLINSLCKNPLLLLSVCIIWEENEQLPADSARLMKDVICCNLNQFIYNEDNNQQKIMCFEEIPQRFVDAMLVLGKCMYKNLKINQLSFNVRDLEGDREIVELALKLGFVYQDSPTSRAELNDVYTASHKLIVEALIGFYFYKQCKLNDGHPLKLCTDEWNFIRDNKYFHNARVFAVQFLGSDAGMMLAHWITNDFSTYRSLMEYLEYVKEEHILNVENTLSRHLAGSNLEVSQRLNKVCISLTKFFHHIYPHEELPEDSNFIEMMRRVYDKMTPSIVEFSECNFHSFFENMSFKTKGRMLAHILLAVKDQEYFFGMFNLYSQNKRHLKYLTNECQKLDFKCDIKSFTFDFQSSGLSFLGKVFSYSQQMRSPGFVMDWLTDSVDGSTIFCDLLILFPKLQYLQLQNCAKTGLNDAIRSSLSERVGLHLVHLEQIIIEFNDLQYIDGSLVARLLLLAPNLQRVFARCCCLTGVTINDMMRECSRQIVDLNLQDIDISDNDLSGINGSSLATLLVMSINLHMLSMKGCSLSGDIINKMVRECSFRRTRLELQKLLLGFNDFSGINGSSLATLLVICPTLTYFNMETCNLKGTVINQMIREYLDRRCHLKLQRFNISMNYLGEIDHSLLSMFKSIASDLQVEMYGVPQKSISKEIRPESALNRTENDDKYKCKICIDRSRSIMLYPCKHLAVCQKCMSKVSICPICGIAIENILKTYPSN